MIVQTHRLICSKDEWILDGDNPLAKDIEVTYQGKKVKAVAVVVKGDL